MSHTGIVLSATTEVFPSRRRAAALCTLTAGHRVTVTERSSNWLGVDVAGVDVTGVGAGGAGAISGFVEATCIALADAEGRGYLAADPGLQSADVEPPAGGQLSARSGAQEAAVSRTWNLYGGLLAVLAERIGIDPAYAAAVVCVESGGHGFGPDGRVVIRFENHIFRRYLGTQRQAEFNRHFQVTGAQPWMGHAFRRAANQPWQAFHGSQPLEWQAYELACGIDEDAATRSISMGLPQVMGFNHELLGYDTPRAMLAFMGADVRFQLLGLFDFVAGPGGGGAGVQALRAGDFDRFATLYNGPGQARYYGDLIEAHVQAFRRLTPARATSGSAGVTKGATAPKRPAAGGGRTYEVRAGDTLGVIAGRLGVTLADLVAVNGIENPNLIYPGQLLTIPSAEPPPPPVVVPSAPPEDLAGDPGGDPDGAAGDTPKAGHQYVVQPGDTLGEIARRAQTTVAELVAANRIENPDLIFPGQVILTPAPVA